MSEHLGIARFKFNEGKREEYKRLSAQAIEIVRTKDSGTLQYDTYFNDDQSECIVIERYRDSEALIEHGEHHRSKARGQQKGRSEDRPCIGLWPRPSSR
jgi:quinol monooxygenase YgiN